MNCIAAVSREWGIGKDGDLIFHISEDMKFFRRMTLGKTLILGRKNLESFPNAKPLPKRRHLLLSRQPDYRAEGVEIFHSVPDVLDAVRDLPEDEVWVVGGGEIYRAFLPFCRRAYITKIDAAPAADVFFPDLDQEEEGWELTDGGKPHEDGGVTYRFCVYESQKPISNRLPV